MALNTIDRGPIRMRDRMYYTVGRVGRSRKVTPEGFLLCEGVAIARTGTQIYAAHEIPGLEPDADGRIVVERLADEVFSPATIASFEGKPITIEHPTDFVGPDNWDRLSVGIVQNVRRGEGIEDDLLLADLLFTKADAIAYVNRELPELSSGYRANYEQTEPGHAIQRAIVGNHVAAVTFGRAGPRISIKDEDIYMKRTNGNFRTALMRNLRKLGVKTDDAAEAVADDLEEFVTTSSETKDDDGVAASVTKILTTVESMDARLKKVEEARTKDEEEEAARQKAEDEAEEKARKEKEEQEAKDAEASGAKEEAVGDTILEAESVGTVLNLGKVYTGDAATDPLKDIGARAEILSPGIQIPTKDSVKGNKGTVLAGFMRQALEKCATTDAGKQCVETFLMGRKIGDLRGHALLGVFNGASELMRTRNNQATQRLTSASTKDFGKPTTIADINKANREFWSKRQAS